MLDSKNTTQIATSLERPLSTIQRRIRLIQEKGILNFEPRLDYSRLGLKKGLLHVYLNDGDLRMAAGKLLDLQGVVSASAHLGNSDIVLEFVFEDSGEVLELISTVKHLNGVQKVVWSEEVYTLSKPMKIVSGND